MKKRKVIRNAALTSSMLLATSMLSGCIGVYGPPPAVYGPPPEPQATADFPLASDTPAPGATYRPEDNIPEDVYGPPADEDFDPLDNLPAPLYGPPELFWIEPTETPVPEGEGQP